MSAPKSRLHDINQPDKVMEAIDRRSAWANFLPLKLRLSIGVALLLITGFLAEDRILHAGAARWSPLFYVAVAGVVMALGAVMSVVDHVATRRRRASKRPPASFD